jgi:hypothetical protein
MQNQECLRQNQECLRQTHKNVQPESKITKYKFSIYHKAILECETDSSDTSSDICSEDTEEEQELYIPPNTKFYEKQNFTAYLTPAKREIIDELDLFSFAKSSIHGEYISDKEYVEYNEDDDQFVCITEGAVGITEGAVGITEGAVGITEGAVEQDANEYLKENNMPYRWSYRGSPAFAKWDKKID